MRNGNRPSLLVVVEPEIFSELLAEVFIAAGEDDVTTASPAELALGSGHRFTVALVSAPLRDETIADLVIQLPPPGERTAEVRSPSGAWQVDVPALSSVLALLDRVSPRPHRRVERIAAWSVSSGNTLG